MEITASGQISQTINSSHFGGNALWHVDYEISKLTQKVTMLGIGNLRWPGGAITELFFDPANPDQPLAVGRNETMTLDPKEILSFTEAMTLAKTTGHALDLVIPTRHLLGEPDANGYRAIDLKAVAEITEFAKLALQLNGQYPDATIASFEIGNEYWGSGMMTAKDYGRLANILVKAVQAGIDAAGSSQSPKILIQMGDAWGPDFEPGGEYYDKNLTWKQILEQANKDVIEGLDATTRKMIDGLIDHHYPRTDNELSYNGWSHEKKLSVWEAAGLKLPTHITEWNLNNYGLKDGQDRFAAGMGLLESFEYMIRMGAGTAHVWPITQSTPTDLTGKAGGEASNLSVSGAVFKLLSENVRGLSWQNTSIEDVSEIESSYYVGADKAVLFLTADDDKALQQTFDLSSLVPGGGGAGVSIKVTQTWVVRNAEMDRWVGKDQGAQIISGPVSANASVSVDLEPYETVMITIERLSPVLPPKPLDKIEGTAGADIIKCGSISETIKSLAGHDNVQGNAGNDTILGQEGDDILFGDAGQDVLQGDRGNDHLYGGTGNDVLYGLANEDRLYGNGGNDRLVGADGNDFFDGGAGNDDLIGGDRNDDMMGGVGNDRLWGDAGNDTLNGGGGNDVLWGGNGDDRITDLLGNANINGDSGNDRIQVGAGSDTVHGAAGNDHVNSGAGNDHVNGGAGNDRLYANSGNDTLLGGDGFDCMIGGAGNDLIHGGGGIDIIVGGHGDDRLFGNAGNDRFYFGASVHGEGEGSFDIVTGGTGADMFIFGEMSGYTEILDYRDGIDRILFHDASVRSMADLTLQASGDDVVITYDGGTVRLSNIAFSEMTADDFVF
ncbi:hypothetical protein GIY56_12570 [Paracoccus sp. YIM 132242]|uniref:Calcium-binding protein n=1 Tax=Paracoccus lichenicola TaxID=2665644 RepID=A0A6L6HV15_9RHOB|nr:calcium-binding protein [Paracoccus lichenicola]MTE01128.1 hypothetical protein [Paracoccus lichenicola]